MKQRYTDQRALSPTPQQLITESLCSNAATGKNTIVSASWFLRPRSNRSPKIKGTEQEEPQTPRTLPVPSISPPPPLLYPGPQENGAQKKNKRKQA